MATNCSFGVAVSDRKSDEPPQIGNPSKWRKTEYMIRLGRFFPPLMIVSQYSQEEEDNMKKEYEEKRQKQKRSRWKKKSAERAKADNADTDDGKAEEVLPSPFAGLSIDNSRTKYWLDRISDQMEKNAKMMKVLAGEMLKPEFPKKVYHTGQKIFDNIGPTAERTGKLMSDVFNVWFGGSLGWDSGDRKR
jgi:hypothetical protein